MEKEEKKDELVDHMNIMYLITKNLTAPKGMKEEDLEKIAKIVERAFGDVVEAFRRWDDKKAILYAIALFATYLAEVVKVHISSEEVLEMARKFTRGSYEGYT